MALTLLNTVDVSIRDSTCRQQAVQRTLYWAARSTGLGGVGQLCQNTRPVPVALSQDNSRVYHLQRSHVVPCHTSVSCLLSSAITHSSPCSESVDTLEMLQRVQPHSRDDVARSWRQFSELQSYKFTKITDFEQFGSKCEISTRTQQHTVTSRNTIFFINLIKGTNNLSRNHKWS